MIAKMYCLKQVEVKSRNFGSYALRMQFVSGPTEGKWDIFGQL